MRAKLIQRMDNSWEIHHIGCGKIWFCNNGSNSWYYDREKLRLVYEIMSFSAAIRISGVRAEEIKISDCFVWDIIRNQPLKYNILGNSVVDRVRVIESIFRDSGGWKKCREDSRLNPFMTLYDSGLIGKDFVKFENCPAAEALF